MMHVSRLRAGVLGLAAAATVLAVMPSASAAVQGTGPACAKPDGHVDASVIHSGVIYVGGSFTHVTDLHGTAQPRAGLAAIDVATCDLLPWRADANDQVYALTVRGSTVYAGGAFTAVAGQSRYGVAALDGTSGKVLTFAPHVNGTVRALASIGTTVYAGGSFTQVGATSRAHLASFDATSGALKAGWAPNADGTVRALVPSADATRLYVGGGFSSLAGDSAYGHLAAVDPTSGAANAASKPSPSFPVLSLAADTRGVYAGGAGAGGHLAIWNADGSLQRPVYQTDGDVQAVAVAGDSVYGGGHFDNYCVGNTGAGAPFICDKALARGKLFAVSIKTGSVTTWAPRANSVLGVFTEAVDTSTGDLWSGGDFTTINGQARPHLAVFRHSAT